MSVMVLRRKADGVILPDIVHLRDHPKMARMTLEEAKAMNGEAPPPVKQRSRSPDKPLDWPTRDRPQKKPPARPRNGQLNKLHGKPPPTGARRGPARASHGWPIWGTGSPGGIRGADCALIVASDAARRGR